MSEVLISAHCFFCATVTNLHTSHNIAPPHSELMTNKVEPEPVKGSSSEASNMSSSVSSLFSHRPSWPKAQKVSNYVRETKLINRAELYGSALLSIADMVTDVVIIVR